MALKRPWEQELEMTFVTASSFVNQEDLWGKTNRKPDPSEGPVQSD